MERQRRHLERRLGDVDRRHLAAGEGRDLLGDLDRRPAGGIGAGSAFIAYQGGDHVYPGQSDGHPSDAPRQHHGETFLGMSRVWDWADSVMIGCAF